MITGRQVKGCHLILLNHRDLVMASHLCGGDGGPVEDWHGRHNLRRAVGEIAAANGVPSTVTHLVYSHHHHDHAGAAFLFGGDVTRIGHEETRRLLRRDDDPARPAPEITFADRYTLQVGGERVELAWHGPNHSPDNIYIHFPGHDTLMFIDVVNAGWVPIYNLNLSEDVPGYMAAPAIALSYPWTHFICGHLGRLATRSHCAWTAGPADRSTPEHHNRGHHGPRSSRQSAAGPPPRAAARSSTGPARRHSATCTPSVCWRLLDVPDRLPTGSRPDRHRQSSAPGRRPECSTAASFRSTATGCEHQLFAGRRGRSGRERGREAPTPGAIDTPGTSPAVRRCCCSAAADRSASSPPSSRSPAGST